MMRFLLLGLQGGLIGWLAGQFIGPVAVYHWGFWAILIANSILVNWLANMKN